MSFFQLVTLVDKTERWINSILPIVSLWSVSQHSTVINVLHLDSWVTWEPIKSSQYPFLQKNKTMASSHGVWRALTSDWSENSFVMLIYQKFLFSRSLENSDWTKKKSLIDSHYKTIYRSVRMACSLYTVFGVPHLNAVFPQFRNCANWTKFNRIFNSNLNICCYFSHFSLDM